jgi:hypothetical protein
MSNQTCSNCKYFARLHDDGDQGLCFRYPPVKVDLKEESVFPDTSDNLFCGEWKLKEFELKVIF